MDSVALAIKSDLWNTLRPLTDLPLDSFAEELMVLELYRRRQISSGKAAELLGIERTTFIQYSSRLGIAFFDMSPEELEAEVSLLENWNPQEVGE